ncbi:hypothetical protein FOCC_FOCC004333 [Frankliniella occidentalis]|uniref:Uncharacterized protein C3orf38 homolog n=1 Tax=Frankliniella occidentalis TaxID=133901 RepID=A0A6J1RWT8_FRAOC|nr:uncharacterized protein C3orf38 homolog [Frankliniella occidentalis]KAE8748928.1 hypothetical protein FOCC_FOCC004333 [Frankliniella occidentalis]
MSGMTENERAFIREFLKLMSDDAVRALASTVTRKMVKAETRRACVDAIVLHSTSLDEFLKRQKVTKENLFKYLNQRKVSVPNTDKAALEQQIKELITGGNLALSSPLQSPVRQSLVPTSPWAVGDHNSSLGSPMPLTSNQPSGAHLPFADLHLPSAAQLYLAATSASRVTIEERVTTTTYSHMSGAALFASMPDPDPRDSAIITEFAKWFYTRVNQPGGLVPEDFWPDANINMIVKRKTDADYKAEQGGSNTARLLNQILEEHQLYLNPNTSAQGIWGRGNVGGLLLVLVCGTLHQRVPVQHRPGIELGQCLGMFENLFLLAQDPFAEDNWKIKTLEVILRSNPLIQQLPTIADSELAKTIRL